MKSHYVRFKELIYGQTYCALLPFHSTVLEKVFDWLEQQNKPYDQQAEVITFTDVQQFTQQWLDADASEENELRFLVGKCTCDPPCLVSPSMEDIMRCVRPNVPATELSMKAAARRLPNPMEVDLDFDETDGIERRYP